MSIWASNVSHVDESPAAGTYTIYLYKYFTLPMSLIAPPPFVTRTTRKLLLLVGRGDSTAIVCSSRRRPSSRECQTLAHAGCLPSFRFTLSARQHKNKNEIKSTDLSYVVFGTLVLINTTCRRLCDGILPMQREEKRRSGTIDD